MDRSRADRAWRKSSRSNLTGCVEVAVADAEVAVRNSRHPDGPVLEFTIDEWRAFLDGVREGEFDIV